MKSQRGFTMIELIIVVIIAAILAVMIYARFPNKTSNVYAQAELLASDIRYTQMLAMSTGQRHRIVFNTTNNSYQILNSAGTAIIMPSGQTVTTLGSGIAFSATWSNLLPNKLINFDTRGVPYIDTASPGTMLAASATVQLVLSGTSVNVSISPYTGRVTT